MTRPLSRGRMPLLGLLATLLAVVPAQADAQRAGTRNITLRDVLAEPTYGGYNISPTGTQVVFLKTTRDPKDWAATSHVWIHDLATSRTFQLTNSPKGEAGARFLPDGRVAFTSVRDTKPNWYAISPNGGEAVKLVDDDSLPTNGSFSANANHFIYTKVTDRSDKKEWEDRVKKKDDGFYAEKKLTYTHIWLSDLQGNKKKQVTTGMADNTSAELSPDARWIAFASNRTNTTILDANSSNNSDLFIVSAEGGEPRQITTNKGPDNSPSFSPDGKWIAYGSSDHLNSTADQTDVKVVSVNGGESRNLTAKFDYSASNILWSPDGASIYFVAAEGLTSKLYKVSAAGGTPVEVPFGKEFVVGSVNMTDDGSKWLVTGATLNDGNIVYLTGRDGANPKRLFAEHSGLGDFRVARAEGITWKGADNLEIEGVLTYPLNYQPGTRYPTILQVHGGPHGRYAATFNSSAQIWAARGYAVFQPNPRGSSGRTFAFSNANTNDWGGKDFIDIMKGVDHVVALGVADSSQLGVMGGSYGGFMTFWTVTQTPRFKGAIGHAGISDWYSFFGQTDIPNLLEGGFGGLPSQSKATYERWSPIEHASKVTTPLLITHGEEDRRVPIAQAEQYYRLLKKQGKAVEFLRYPREGHGIAEPMHRLQLDVEQEKWMDQHVRKRVMKAVSSNR
ncbi:MAG: S9 family peptidase [Phycisphaerae bacterium]|nr:S9 family peptidase [Gemmatimonadaceae bacterium]